MPETVEIRNGSRLYRVDKPVTEATETDNYRLYLCTETGTEHQCLLQIATDRSHNRILQRAAYILRELARRAEELEAEYASVKKDPNVFLNYNLGFPELIDSFICEDQGRRQINILAFRNVEDVGRMVPLTNLEKDRLRVDLKTSAWITGKLLKTYDLAVNERFSVNIIGNNILIEPDQHYVVIFDWTGAQIYSTTVPAEERRKQIMHAAQAVIMALGRDPKTKKFPGDAAGMERCTSYLLQLSRGGESNVKRAHAHFYEIADSLWERKFHPFTTKSLES